MAQTTSSRADRQCWECQRRRWICDAARPICRRCRESGIVCPGYGDTKPLIWLAPGRVTSRNRRGRSGYASLSTKGWNTVASRTSEPETDQRWSDGPTEPTESGLTPASSSGNGSNGHGVEGHYVDDPSVDDDLASSDGRDRQTSHCSSSAVAFGHRSNPKFLQQLASQAAIKFTTEPRHEFFDMIEAIKYYNKYIYPELREQQIAPCPFVSLVASLGDLPPSTQHASISLTISYRVMHMAQAKNISLDPDKPFHLPLHGDIGELWARVRHQNWLAVRELNREISNDQGRCSPNILTAVLMVLYSELTQSASPHWRAHVNGFMSLVKLRGGLRSALITYPIETKLTLVKFITTVVASNTTSPSYEQIAVEDHSEAIYNIKQFYGILIDPPFLCPSYLFLDLIRINYLRYRIAMNPELGDTEQIQAEAVAIMKHITAFSPATWIERSSMPDRVESLLIAQIFQTSVALFCVSSLPCLSTPPPNTDLARYQEFTKTIYRPSHFVLLDMCMKSPITRRSMCWPLVVAGVEAASGPQAQRDVVFAYMSQLRADIGVPMLVAKAFMERFWASGKLGWENCFRQPCSLVA